MQARGVHCLRVHSLLCARVVSVCVHLRLAWQRPPLVGVFAVTGGYARPLKGVSVALWRIPQGRTGVGWRALHCARVSNDGLPRNPMAVLPKYPCLRADNTLGAESLSMGVAAPKGGCGPWEGGTSCCGQDPYQVQGLGVSTAPACWSRLGLPTACATSGGRSTSESHYLALRGTQLGRLG